MMGGGRGFYLFLLVKIPGKMIRLDIVKPLSNILTTKGIVANLGCGVKKRSLLLSRSRSCFQADPSSPSLRQRHSRPRCVLCLPPAQGSLLFHHVVSVVRVVCVLSRWQGGVNATACHAQVCLHLLRIFTFHLLVVVMKALGEKGKAEK